LQKHSGKDEVSITAPASRVEASFTTKAGQSNVKEGVGEQKQQEDKKKKRDEGKQDGKLTSATYCYLI